MIVDDLVDFLFDEVFWYNLLLCRLWRWKLVIWFLVAVVVLKIWWVIFLSHGFFVHAHCTQKITHYTHALDSVMICWKSEYQCCMHNALLGWRINANIANFMIIFIFWFIWYLNLNMMNLVDILRNLFDIFLFNLLDMWLYDWLNEIL